MERYTLLWVSLVAICKYCSAWANHKVGVWKVCPRLDKITVPKFCSGSRCKFLKPEQVYFQHEFATNRANGDYKTYQYNHYYFLHGKLQHLRVCRPWGVMMKMVHWHKGYFLNMPSMKSSKKVLWNSLIQHRLTPSSTGDTNPAPLNGRFRYSRVEKPASCVLQEHHSPLN